MNISFSTWTGTLGVAILLIAFFLNLSGRLSTQNKNYALLNFAGAAISCYASFLIHFVPFIILEAAWKF